MALVIAASIIAYITTEIDDLLLMLILFSRAKNKSEKVCIVIGKFLGLAILVCCCSIFAVYISKVPAKYIGILGVIPIAIGVKTIFEKKDAAIAAGDGSTEPFLQTDTFLYKLSFIASTVVVTLASGGDNIAVYIPFFTSLHGLDFLTMSIVFVVMQALWCILSLLVINATAVAQFNRRYYRVVVPVLFILLGIYIMLKDGTFLWILGK